MNASSILAKLPPEKGIEQTIVRGDQSLEQIKREMLEAHQVFAEDYDLVAEKFAGPDAERKLWQFCKDNLAYDVESGMLQTTASPTVMLNRGVVDCKGYASFIGGVLDALNRAGQGHYNWCYRFAEYDYSDVELAPDEEPPAHVFVVVKKPGGRETWIDPVLNGFDKKTPQPMTWDDKCKPMTLVRLSGIHSPGMTALPARTMPGSVAGPLRGYTASRVGTYPAAGFTPYQLGTPIAAAVFEKYGDILGAMEVTRNPPVRFFVGNSQIPLPPPTTYGGQPVPLIPDGLHMVWDSTFMGKTIPVDMLNVSVSNGTLKIYPLEIGSAGGTNDATNRFLWEQNRWLLFLFLGALENLIYSYSSYAWGNGWDDLSGYVYSNRNYSNWLIYPWHDKKTFFGNVLATATQVISTVQNVIAPVEGIILNTVVPGLGGAAVNLTSGLLNAANSATHQTTTVSQNYMPQGSFPQLPGTVPQVPGQAPPTYPGTGPGVTTASLVSQVVQFAQANPIPTIGIIAAIGVALYELSKD